MNTIAIEKGSTLMVAHRGLSGLETENSIPAFIAAGNRSYVGIETDIHVTSDGKIVVIHDDETGRVAVRDVIVEETSFDELRAIPLKDLRTPDLEGRRDIIIPTLEEYIRICKKYEKTCVLELKNRFIKSDIVKVIDEIKAYDYLDGVIFISFSLDNMIDLRDLLPGQRLQYLVTELSDDVVEALDKYALDLDINWKGIDEKGVEKVHAMGRKVNCWTVDDPEVAAKLVSWGVDYITTNILE